MLTGVKETCFIQSINQNVDVQYIAPLKHKFIEAPVTSRHAARMMT